jgi:hypothetical protein
MKLSAAEISTLKNACYVANDRFREDAKTMHLVANRRDIDNAGSGETFRKLARQFETQVDDTAKLLTRLDLVEMI